MIKKSLLSMAAIAAISVTSFSQETSYYDYRISHQQKPAYPQYAAYTTFDMAAITTMDEEVNMELPYQIKLGDFKQVSSGADFHIVSILRRMSGKFTSDKSITANVYLTSYVYDKYGNKVTGIYTDKEDYVINFETALSKDDRGNKDLVRRKVVEKITESNLSSFVEAFKGAKIDVTFELAGLSDVKKKPDLADFSKKVKEIKVPSGATAENWRDALAPNVSYWEKMSEYAGPDEVNEVKRAAYQNLAIYHIFAGNTEKATEYIEKYKPVDKVDKQLMGLLKIWHSDNCEKMLQKLYPEVGEVDEKAPLLSLQEIKDGILYETITGTVTVEGKKIGGTYQGKIQVSKLDNASSGGIASLDAAAALVVITTKDEKGEAKVIKTDLSNITSLKDDKGTEYAIMKFGVVTGKYYCLLKPAYKSDKVAVYRTLIPAGSTEYFVKKAGDEKGVKSTLIGARKQLTEYLSDCPVLTEKLKNGTIDKKEKVETIAEMYTKCESVASN